MEGFIDVDYARNMDIMKSTFFVLLVERQINILLWRYLRLKWSTFSLLKEKMKLYIWFKGVIGVLGISQRCVKVHCDRQSENHFANHQVYRERRNTHQHVFTFN
jgi:hypothetical protein